MMMMMMMMMMMYDEEEEEENPLLCGGLTVMMIMTQGRGPPNSGQRWRQGAGIGCRPRRWRDGRRRWRTTSPGCHGKREPAVSVWRMTGIGGGKRDGFEAVG
jgi:hypothetical protein